MVEVLALVADPLTQNVFVLTSYYPQNMRQFLVSAINVLVFISSRKIKNLIWIYSIIWCYQILYYFIWYHPILADITWYYPIFSDIRYYLTLFDIFIRPRTFLQLSAVCRSERSGRRRCAVHIVQYTNDNNNMSRFFWCLDPQLLTSKFHWGVE